MRFGVYHKLRYSKPYEAFLWIKNPSYLRALRDDLTFYRSALGSRRQLIFDIGANQGDKTWVFRQIAKRVVAVEPDSYSWSALTARFGGDPNVYLENMAVGAEIGRANFYVEAEGSAYNTLSHKWASRLSIQPTTRVRTVDVSTLDRLITKYGRPDYAKIDVEGYELAIFRGFTGRIPVISFEANLPMFREETLEILTHFKLTSSSHINLRLGNAPAFVFPTHQYLPKIRQFITETDGTFDVFVFQE